MTTVGIFYEENLELYRGCFEQVSEEIHFYAGFNISDRYRETESRFFGKFVDVTDLVVKNHTLSREELKRICDSFPNVKRIDRKLRHKIS